MSKRSLPIFTSKPEHMDKEAVDRAVVGVRAAYAWADTLRNHPDAKKATEQVDKYFKRPAPDTPKG